MQWPIISGVYADEAPDFRTAIPKNLIPVPQPTGVSDGYLKTADGLTQNGTGEGFSRGGVVWRDVLYRVTGTKLVKVEPDGQTTVLGDVGGQGPVSMAYGFDYLAIASGNELFLYDADTDTLTRNSDRDRGLVKDVIWVDGYFFYHDGEFLVVTELGNPFQVKPDKYASSEVEPDPVIAVEKVRNEVYACNRTTIEVFTNVGGTGFPFTRVDGAQIRRGPVGTHAVCNYQNALAFVGSGEDEPDSVYLGANGTTLKLATPEIEERLEGYTGLGSVEVEAVGRRGHEWLMIHLPDTTLVYDAAATAVMQRPIWFELTSNGDGYRGRHFVWAYSMLTCGNPKGFELGYLDKNEGRHWGEHVAWDFTMPLLYNEARGAVVHDLELVTVKRPLAVDTDPKIGMQYSLDGESWSDMRWIPSDDRRRRLKWTRQGRMSDFRTQRVTGFTDMRMAMARLEGNVEPLQW